MQLKSTPIAGLIEVQVTLHEDERGAFARTYDEEVFSRAGLPTSWPHCNTSWNKRRGTLRGMHWQAAPKEESKLVRCTAGHVYDVAVDLRRESPTYRNWFGVELSASRRNALFIPAGVIATRYSWSFTSRGIPTFTMVPFRAGEPTSGMAAPPAPLPERCRHGPQPAGRGRRRRV